MDHEEDSSNNFQVNVNGEDRKHDDDDIYRIVFATCVHD